MSLQDHRLDVLTNSVGLAAALLADRFYWWIDPLGAMLLALYTVFNWFKTVIENAGIVTSPFPSLSSLMFVAVLGCVLLGPLPDCVLEFTCSYVSPFLDSENSVRRLYTTARSKLRGQCPSSVYFLLKTHNISTNYW